MRTVVAALVSLFFCASTASAQGAGAIAGVVRDATGGVMPGVTVEASSPALIEKVRTVVTDDQGNYKIVDLRPGTYTVKFTLQGFATYQHENIELSTGFTATANAEMKVGALEEVVTVTGATPIVDIQNVRAQNVLTETLLDALPVQKTITGFGAVTLGATTTVSQGVQDVGGNKGENSSSLALHGGRSGDMRRLMDGMSFSSLRGTGGGPSTLFRVNMVGVRETVLETVSNAESETGGVQLNYVPKDGGNRFSTYFTAAYADENLASDNLNDDLRARGLTQAASVRRIHDVGGGVGGPIRRERLWFYAMARDWGAQEYQPGAFLNRTLNTMFYTADFSRPLYTSFPTRDFGLRFTWQAAAKHKVTFSQNLNRGCLCNRGSATVSLEAAPVQWIEWAKLIQTTWMYPATNRLLFQAGASFGYFPLENRPYPELLASSIGILELSTGLRYGPNTVGFPGGNPYHPRSNNDNHNQRASVSYVTGSHALKAGAYMMRGVDNTAPYIVNDLSYTFRNQAPVSLTQWASPTTMRMRLWNLGIYGQDQWTVKRVTFTAGMRYDHFTGRNLPEQLPARRFVPATEFAAVERVPDFRDVTPRAGVAVDLFGTGRTAIKAAIGRYVQSLGTGSYTLQAHPALSLVASTTRTWLDSNGNFVPDCVLTNPAINGECGAIDNTRFGTSVPSTRYDDEVIRGFGERAHTWQVSTSFEQQLRPGVGVNVGYFRTWHGNFSVTQNVAVTPADFTPFCVPVPANTQLPGGGGGELCGFHDVNPSRFGQVNSVVVKTDAVGGRSEVFNGVDVAMNARFGAGGSVQGGVSFGRTVIDTCGMNNRPDLAGFAALSKTTPFCHDAPPWSAGTQIKLSGVYPLPFGIEASATFQNLPGVQILASRTYTSAEVAPSLGRPLAAGPNGTVTLPIVPPGTLFEDRLTQVDVRAAKGINVGGAKVRAMVDVYNLFNSGVVLALNTTYGPTWLRPTGILGSRMFKFGVQLDLE